MTPGSMQNRLRNWSPRFSPAWFKAFLVAVVAAAFAVPLGVLALPYLDILNDMAVQPKGKAQGYYGWFEGEARIVERPPAARSMPMDYYPYHLEGKDEATAKLAEESLANPLPATLAAVDEGEKHFNYYCWTCHGKEGYANGPIIGPERFPAPPSLHTDSARAFKDGRIFHIISRGQNKMPSYADKFSPRERWAIVHYVRALQRSQNPKAEDLEK
ncbi:MAG: cytochrome c [Planctomycetes bacterium]|nr:cytochrome c [Planctomycetota bacterium]